MSPSVFPPLRWCGQATGAGAGHPHTLPPACPRSRPGGGRPFPSRFPGTGSLSWGMLGAPSSKDACPSPNWSHWAIFLGSLGGPTGAPVGETHESVGPEAEGPGAARRAGLRARRQRSAATVAAAPAWPGPARLRLPRPQVSPGSGRRRFVPPPFSARPAFSYCKEESDNVPAPSLPPLKADVPK